MDLRKVVIIGAGTMGSGIAQWFTQQHLQTFIVDKDQSFAESALRGIHQSWDKLQSKEKFSKHEVQKFKTHISVIKMEEIPSDVDLIIEAVFENMDVKKEIFRYLDENLHIKTILASNTSSLSINEMANFVQPERRKNFLGLHFFNPAPIMKLVEVVTGMDTQEETAKKLYKWFEDKGKKPAICIDSPAFIVNRVARNFYGEPLRIVQDFDREKIKEVDDVLKSVGGFRMGPFELMDLIGIDINYEVTCSVWEAYNKASRFAPHPLQKDRVDKNCLGRKSNEGFYRYE